MRPGAKRDAAREPSGGSFQTVGKRWAPGSGMFVIISQPRAFTCPETPGRRNCATQRIDRGIPSDKRDYEANGAKPPSEVGRCVRKRVVKARSAVSRCIGCAAV